MRTESFQKSIRKSRDSFRSIWDGIGPKESRKKMINTNWGGVVEDNSFGTHEFFELCRQIGCETYINGNMGSGTVQEMSEWVEYMTFDGVSPMADLRAEI